MAVRGEGGFRMKENGRGKMVVVLGRWGALRKIKMRERREKEWGGGRGEMRGREVIRQCASVPTGSHHGSIA